MTLQATVQKLQTNSFCVAKHDKYIEKYFSFSCLCDAAFSKQTLNLADPTLI